MTSPSQTDVASQALRAQATQAYATQSRSALEERLILDYLPLVRHVVQKLASQISGLRDIEDLISAGTVGLVRAARAFDPGRNVEFKTYAYIRVRGAVIDELRQRSFVPSGVHAQVRQLQQAYQQLAGRLGHAPDDEELAGELGMSLRELYRLLEDARSQHFLSIHGLTEDKPALGSFLPSADEPAPSAQLERRELMEKLARAIAELSEKERLVVLLYYERDLTMKEAAAVLGVTESRVSQLHAGALFKLSMKMRDQT